MLTIISANKTLQQQAFSSHSKFDGIVIIQVPRTAGLFVLNMSCYIVGTMKQTFLILFSLLLLFGCGGNSGQQPKEKADRLTQQAEEEIGKNNYEEAERLLTESINLHAETNNEAKLTENYSTLSTAQVLAGKLSSALESLIALRGYYGRAGIREAELQTMLQIGNMYFQLGRKKESLAILIEVFNNSQLYKLERLHAKAALDIASIYAAIGRHKAAIPYLNSAAAYYIAKNDLPNLIETRSAQIFSLASIGRIDDTFDIYNKSKSLIEANPSGIDEPLFFLRCGEAFAQTEEYSFAKTLFEYGLALTSQQPKYKNSPSIKFLHIGLGELYYRNFVFEESQNHFTKAYEAAKNGNNGIISGYILVRIADCLSKQAAHTRTNDGFIRATQLYEQSLNLFARAGLGFGEAIALHRLGLVRQLLKDENAAITFYKRAFEKYSQNTIPPAFYGLPVKIQQLCTSISVQNTIGSWFSENLLTLLLSQKKFSEALSYYETVRNIGLQSELGELQLQFHEKAKDKRYGEYRRTIQEKNTTQLELFNLNALQKPNKNYANKLLRHLTYLQSKITSDGITFQQEYPLFTFLNGLQKSTIAALTESIPSSSTVLDFCLVGNELWVFIVRNSEEVNAVKLSSFGYSLANTMELFMNSFYRASVRTIGYAAANELYTFLIQPVESSGKESFIIIPPVGFEKFPFHILTKNDRPLVDMINVLYLPNLSFIFSHPASEHTAANISAFGFTTDSRWGLEFELRDIRSFFKNTQANINLTATPEKLSSSTGDVLQLSSLYQKNEDGHYSFLLSSGSTLKSGASVSIEKFVSYHSYPVVYLSDVQSTENNVSMLHPVLWLLNGSASVIATQLPITANISKSFGESFYSSLMSEDSPAVSYRRAVSSLERKKELFGRFAGASYFYYGSK
jgi:hypothetical protein